MIKRNNNTETDNMAKASDIRDSIEIVSNGRTISIKAEQPADIKADMDTYRANGCWATPISYQNWHRTLAAILLSELESRCNVLVLKTESVSDGWMDGNHVLRAVVETPSRKLVDLRWHPGNKGFMVKETVGNSILFLNELN
jgi:hypothetical protein